MRIPILTASILVACSVAAVGASAFAADGVSTRVIREARAAVAESARELPGGIIETVRIFAREAVSKDPNAQKVQEAFVDVLISRFDPATGTTTFFAATNVELRPGEFQIAPSLRSARLIADIPVSDAAGTSDVVSANLQWQASETSEATTLTEFARTPGVISLTTNADELRFDATVSGSVTYPLGTVTELTGLLAKQQISTRTFFVRGGSSGPAQLTRSSTTLEGSALFADVSYATQIDECLVGVVSVSAQIPADGAPQADVRVEEVDVCLGGSTVFEATGVALPAGALVIAPDFSSATLNTPIEINGQFLALDLTWSGGEQLSAQTLRREVATPTGVVTAITQGIISEAVVTGSVTTPTRSIAAPDGTVGFLGSQFAATTTTQQ